MAIQRVKYRVASGGHDIPEATIRRRYQKGVRNFFSLYRELTDSWSVYDNSTSFAPVLIANGKKGAERILDSDLWQHFREVSQ